jgi:ferritin
MLKDKVQAALNQQVNTELGAYYTYLSMSAYFESAGFSGFAAWMYHHAEEEMTHAMKIYKFIHDRRGVVTLGAIPAPATSWPNARAAFEDALHHEQMVTASINNLVELARAEKDYATDSFLAWFVDEQVEEEAIVDAVLQKLNMIGDFGPGLYMLDRELAVPAAEEGEAEGEES